MVSVSIHLFRRFTESFHNFYEAGQMLLGPLWDPKHDQWTAQWPARPHRKGTDPKSMDLARIRKIQKNLRVYKTIIQLHCNHEVSLKLWKIFKLRCSKARLGSPFGVQSPTCWLAFFSRVYHLRIHQVSIKFTSNGRSFPAQALKSSTVFSQRSETWFCPLCL